MRMSEMKIGQVRNGHQTHSYTLPPIWAPDAAIREKILVANPARLYGFR